MVERIGSRKLKSCNGNNHQISNLLFILLFPLCGISCLMQLRVGIEDCLIVLAVQTAAYGFQDLMGTTRELGDLRSNVVPALVATVASHVCIPIFYHLNLTKLEVHFEGYFAMKKTYQFNLALEEGNGTNQKGQDELSISVGGNEENKNGGEKSSSVISYFDSDSAESNKRTPTNRFQTWIAIRGSVCCLLYIC